MRLALAGFLVASVLVGCGGVDRSAAHDEVIEQLPAIKGTELLEVERNGFCLKDSCPFGDDAMNTVLTFGVGDGTPSQRDLIDAYRSIDPENADTDFCETLDTDPQRCLSEEDHRASVRIELGEQFVYVDTLTWDEGTYQLIVGDIQR